MRRRLFSSSGRLKYGCHPGAAGSVTSPVLLMRTAQHPRPDRYLLLQTPGERKGPARLRVALDGEHQAAGLLEIDRPGSLVDQAVRLDGRAGLDEAMIGQGSRLREEYGIPGVNPGARRDHTVKESRHTLSGIEQ